MLLERELKTGQSGLLCVHTDLHPALSLLYLHHLLLLPGEGAGGRLSPQMSPVAGQRHLLLQVSVEIVLDLTLAKLLLKGCL